MTRALVILSRDADRAKAINYVATAPLGTRVEFKAARRSLDQNSAMWSYLTCVAAQLEWHGQKYSPEDWKDYMMHALRRARWMPSEDGGMVPVGMRTSDLSKAEMSELLELISAFAAQHGVTLHDPSDAPAQEKAA